MKFNIKIILSSIALLAAVLIVIWKFYPENAPAEPSGKETVSDTKHGRVHVKNNGDKLTPEPSDSGINSPLDTTKDGDPTKKKEFIIFKIDEASTTYDAAYLPVIKPYLLNADPEIRAEAVNGMLILGDSAASPMLREAAKQMTNAEDIKAMLEAAEFLELPRANLKEIFKKNKAAKAPQPSDK